MPLNKALRGDGCGNSLWGRFKRFLYPIKPSKRISLYLVSQFKADLSKVVLRCKKLLRFTSLTMKFLSRHHTNLQLELDKTEGIAISTIKWLTFYEELLNFQTCIILGLMNFRRCIFELSEKAQYMFEGKRASDLQASKFL